MQDIKINDTKIDGVVLDQLNTIIKKQYINFENLGSNLLTHITNPYKQLILDDLITFYNTNYSPLAIELHNSTDLGLKLYSFICIDFYNTILPSFLEHNNLNSYNEFDAYLRIKMKYDMDSIKSKFSKIINDIILKFNNLEKLDKFISKDKNFIDIINKYTFYQLLFNMTDMQLFLENYIVPTFIKNEEDTIWKI